MRKRPLFTPSMLKILARHASGLSLKDVAREIYVSYSAVTNTMYDARKRVGVDSNAALVIRAHSLGLLSHPTGPDQQVFVLNPIDEQD
jgi:DNA-binding NarL/FixJ family response regulator